MKNERQIRGLAIISKGDTPQVVSKDTYLVPSQSDENKKYKVTHVQEWKCNCPDFRERGIECKHIHAIKFYLKFKSGINIDTVKIENELNKDVCPECHTENIQKDGVRKNKNGVKQRYKCQGCGKRFVLEPIKYIKGSSKIVCLVMDLYFKGLSLRDIKDTMFQFYDFNISHETIRLWIVKFTRVMNDYTKQFNPKTSHIWHVDEQAVKVGKDFLWSWNVLDSTTRFLLANQITKKREINDVRKVLKKAKETTEVTPNFVVTDGLRAYEKGIKKEFMTNPMCRKPYTKHIRDAGFKDNVNNNRVERYHNAFREFDKVRRGFDNIETAQANNEGFALFHNFIHQGQDGLTPSQRAQINLDLEKNRWLSLLKQALDNQITPEVDKHDVKT
ncbi:IS1/IS6 family transposase [Candidatus Woesearchaeota archaeon]|nr:IS1/IS6 family transposase [Candidatus Woesearchaeota archaeon]